MMHSPANWIAPRVALAGARSLVTGLMATLIALLVGTGESAAAPPAIEVEECVVRFAEVVDVPALDAGPLAEVAVAQNQQVQPGQLLARLDDRSLAIRRRAAELRRKIAQEKLEDDLEIQFAETAYQEAMEELESNRAVYEASSGAVPLSTLRRLRLAVERANLERERVKKLGRQAEVELELQTAELEVIDDHLRRLQVKSPISGVVLVIEHDEGEWVATGESVAQVARMDRLQVQALLSEDALPPRTAVGASVMIRWSEAGQEHALRGRVVSVDPQVLSGGRYRIHANVENRAVAGGWLLAPGREVQMLIHPLASPSTPTDSPVPGAAPVTVPQAASLRLFAPGEGRR